ncbi:MAG: DUF1572 family protein [Phycisphaeraceae bacterium]|nr:DUF1572 family protein [Phycisphaeraceae bacterium]
MADHRYTSPWVGGRIEVWTGVFARQRAFSEHCLRQLDDARFFATPGPGMNSCATIVRHIAGNLSSRFTDFLTADGEKSTRDRDAELAPLAPPADGAARAGLRAAIMRDWEAGWSALERTLGALGPDELERIVTIRTVPHSVHAAIARAMDHLAFHGGQISVIARMLVGTERWEWFTIPPGGSRAFNASLGAARPSP